MRTKKAMINASISAFTYITMFLPMFFLRKTFLDKLGVELLGLNSLYTNIISYLSIVEMGIGNAIIFSLYKTFADKNYIKVKGYLNFYKKFYRNIAIIILLLGIAMIPFLKFFIRDNINMTSARLYFLLFLIDVLISYLFSYKLCILNVNQESYKISIGMSLTKSIIAILQIILLNLYANYYSFLVIQIVINMIYYFIINTYINKQFKWLNKVKGMISTTEKRELIKSIKALFLHKIGWTFVGSTDNIVISSFISLTMVAKFNNYNMIIVALQGIILTAMNSIVPSVGNLLVEHNNEEISYKIYKRLFFLNFWLSSFSIIALFNTITQFVKLWMGTEQSLSSITIIILLINLYFYLMGTPIDNFKNAAGLYHEDRYATIIEGIINLIFSIILAKLIGLPGVFLGTLISNITVVFWVKPLIIYKHIFKKSLKDYFKMYFKYFIIALITLFLTNFITNKISQNNSIVSFLINCVINIVFINLIYIIIFSKNEEFKYFKNMVLGIMKNLKKRVFL